MSDPPREGLSVRGLTSVIAVSGLLWSISVFGSGIHPFAALSGESWNLPPAQGQSPLWHWLSPDGTRPSAWLWTIALIACEALSAGVLARLTAREAGSRAGLCAAAALTLSPFFGPIGGAFALFNAPAWLCWLLTLEYSALALQQSPSRTRHALIAAVACASTFACHPQAATLLIGLALGLMLLGPVEAPFHRPSVRFLLRPALALALFALPIARVVTGMPAENGTALFDQSLELVCVQSIQMFPWFWMLLIALLVRGWFRLSTGLDRDAPPGERLRLAVATTAWGTLSLAAVLGSAPPSTGLIGLASMLPTVGRLWASALDRPRLFFRTRLALYSLVAVLAITFGFRQAPWYERLTSPDAPGRQTRHTLQAAGFRWTYTLYAPLAGAGSRLRPASLVLHGSGSRGSTFLAHTNWMPEAEQNGFLVIAPDALPLDPMRAPHWLLNPRVWNSGQHPANHPRRRVDDLAFFDALLADLNAREPIDPRRVYLAGHSSGAAMAFRLASERAEAFASVAAISGTCYVTDSRPSRPVPTLFVLGGKDVVLPPRGGLSVLPWEIRRTPPVGQSLTRWSRALGGWPIPCAFDVPQSDVVVKYYGPRPSVHLMTVVLLEKYGHAWPGSQGWQFERLLSPTFAEVESIDATHLVCTFFQKQFRPEVLTQTTTRLIR